MSEAGMTVFQAIADGMYLMAAHTKAATDAIVDAKKKVDSAPSGGGGSSSTDHGISDSGGKGDMGSASSNATIAAAIKGITPQGRT